jgi:hypothetical protein
MDFYHYVGFGVVWGGPLALLWLLCRQNHALIARLRGARAVVFSRRCVVVTYDEQKPANVLGEIHLCGAASWELPERLANACLVAVEYDKIDSQQGQDEALKFANELLNRPRY